MIAEYRDKANICTGIAVLIFAALYFGPQYMVGHISKEIASNLIFCALSIGGILWVLGTSYYAKAKGYSFVLGLLGLIGIVGLIVILVLPNKHR